MATPREVTQEEYCKLYNKCYEKARKNAKLAERRGESAYWFSCSFSPCKTKIPQTGWKEDNSPDSIRHYTNQPCDEFCQDKLPMATCLVKLYVPNTDEVRFYICRHKVGSCPWKE